MKIPNHLPRLAFLLLILFAPPSATFALDLYTGEATIVDETEQGKDAAIREAFRSMLIKLVGIRERVMVPELSEEINRAQDYVVSYGFRENDGPGVRARRIRASFDQERVDAMLASHGIPVWRVGRPEVVAWVVLDENGRRRLMQPDQDQRLLNLLRDAGEARGLAIVFPLMDLEDQARVDAQTVSRGITPELRVASARYGGEALLVARLTDAAGGIWSTEWILSADGVQDNWARSAGVLRVVAEEAAERAVEKLAARFAPPMLGAVDDGELRSVVLRLEEVRGRRDFARVNRMIPRLGAVREAVIQIAEPEAVVYRLEIRGGEDALRAELQRSGILQPAPGGGPGELRYRLGY